MSDILFTPASLGKLQLKNRIVMAPMTRSRATGNVPNELMEKYYQLAPMQDSSSPKVPRLLQTASAMRASPACSAMSK